MFEVQYPIGSYSHTPSSTDLRMNDYIAQEPKSPRAQEPKSPLPAPYYKNQLRYSSTPETDPHHRHPTIPFSTTMQLRAYTFLSCQKKTLSRSRNQPPLPPLRLSFSFKRLLFSHNSSLRVESSWRAPHPIEPNPIKSNPITPIPTPQSASTS